VSESGSKRYAPGVETSAHRTLFAHWSRWVALLDAGRRAHGIGGWQVAAWGVAFMWGLALLVLPSAVLVLRGLEWLSWVAMGAALGLAGERWFDMGVLALMHGRGLTAREQTRVALGSGALVLWRLLRGPTLLLAGIALCLSRSWAQLGERALLGVGALAYAMVVALVLGAGAWGCRRISVKGGRRLFLGVLVVPHLLREIWPIPSVPAWLGGVLSNLERWAS